MITLDDIKQLPDVEDALDWPFDFSLPRAERKYDWIRLTPEIPFQVIAGEGTGGAFLVYGEGPLESLPILHATSEGAAGKVAANLTEWLGILIAIPYWQDLLKFSGGGRLEEMRLAATFMEREYEEDYPDLPAARDLILAKLPIPPLDDPIKVLHDNVHGTGCTLISNDGDQWESLFNTFTPADNRSWIPG